MDGQLVTGGYFPLLGVRPALGRLFGPDDDRAVLGHPVAVLSHGYWMRRFGGDASAIGRTLVVSGTPLTIVGVTPAEFFGTEVGTRPGMFLPMMMQPAVMPLTGNLLQQPRVMSNALRILGRLDETACRSNRGPPSWMRSRAFRRPTGDRRTSSPASGRTCGWS